MRFHHPAHTTASLSARPVLLRQLARTRSYSSTTTTTSSSSIGYHTSSTSSSMAPLHEQTSSNLEAAAAAVTEAEAMHPGSFWSRFRWRPTSKAEAAQAERSMLSRLLRLPWEVSDVHVGAPDEPEHYMHTTSGGDPSGPTLVLCPGYGAGTGFFHRNLDGLARAFRVYAVDWLGTGLSGRPAFPATDRASAEDFFLESLHAWRAQQGLDKFILVGHSLGGYLAALYALRHPEHVQHLVLVGPAGIPPKPAEWEQRFLSQPWSMRAQLYKLAARAWVSGVTPGSVVRGMGPWGPRLIDRYVSGRFQHHGQALSQAEQEAFSPYFYHISAARGSGEYALRHLLAPGAWAHAPLAQRLHDLKVPVTFVYGSGDWMNPAAGVAVAEQLDSVRARKVPSDHKVEVIDNAGHFVFLEQPQLFNAALLRITAPYLKRGLAERLISEETEAARRLAKEQQEHQGGSGDGEAPAAPAATES